ncbi:MAG: hypothetical protein KDB22_19205 [Planctomycetales bacterium]|nr:hypothetical protein [Planctomycetales bacterium]
MVKWIVSIVFCISIVAGSNAHASMLAGKLLHAASTQHQTSLANCWEEPRHAIASADIRCMHMANSQTGGQRCQIDVAPLVSTQTLPDRAVRSDDALASFELYVGAGRAPPLGPPRPFQVT